MRPRRAAVVVVAAGLSLLVGCSSSAKSPAALPPIQPDATTTIGTLAPNVARPKVPLEFRQVSVAIPATTPIKTVAGSGGTGPTQQCSELITPRVQQRADNPSEILFDRRRQACYVLGASLVPSTSVESATVRFDATTKSWATQVHFKSDVFQKNVAGPLVGKQVAIVLAGFVQSAPMIKAGSTGASVDIVGGFTKAGAVEVAAAIMGVAPVSVTVDSTGS